jgi:hypothetical protein
LFGFGGLLGLGSELGVRLFWIGVDYLAGEGFLLGFLGVLEIFEAF